MPDKTLLPSVPDSFYLTPHAWELEEESNSAANNPKNTKDGPAAKQESRNQRTRPSKSNRQNQQKSKKEEILSKQVKKIDHNLSYPIENPGAEKKLSVFDRLGEKPDNIDEDPQQSVSIDTPERIIMIEKHHNRHKPQHKDRGKQRDPSEESSSPPSTHKKGNQKKIFNERRNGMNESRDYKIDVNDGAESGSDLKPVEGIKKKINFLEAIVGDIDWSDLVPGQEDFEYT